MQNYFACYDKTPLSTQVYGQFSPPKCALSTYCSSPLGGHNWSMNYRFQSISQLTNQVGQLVTWSTNCLLSSNMTALQDGRHFRMFDSDDMREYEYGIENSCHLYGDNDKIYWGLHAPSTVQQWNLVWPIATGVAWITSHRSLPEPLVPSVACWRGGRLSPRWKNNEVGSGADKKSQGFYCAFCRQWRADNMSLWIFNSRSVVSQHLARPLCYI
jgi:hypothetical protein